MFELVVETGDTSAGYSLQQFHLEEATPSSPITLVLGDARACVQRDDWGVFVNQASEHALRKWQYSSDYPEPMGSPTVRKLVLTIRSTAVYQLFLAAFEIAQRIRFGFLDAEKVLGKARQALSDVYTGKPKLGGLYFLPYNLPNILKLEGNEEALENLIDNNKLCSVALMDDAGILFKHYYVPYATPISRVQAITGDERLLWNRIRDLHFQAVERLR